MGEKTLTEIEVLNKELDRLHHVLGHGDAKANGYILQRIMNIEDLLMTITKKNNGMEW